MWTGNVYFGYMEKLTSVVTFRCGPTTKRALYLAAVREQRSVGEIVRQRLEEALAVESAIRTAGDTEARIGPGSGRDGSEAL